jgi:predicted DNA-binding transcriptional regulator AlpA
VIEPIVATQHAPDKPEPQDVFISDTELCRRWRISKVSLWRRRRDDPRFPKPVRAGFARARNTTLMAAILAYEAIVLAEGVGGFKEATKAAALARARN